MKKIMVHIKNNDAYMDDRVYAFIELSHVPRVGEFLFLSEETNEILESDISRVKRKEDYSEWIFAKDEISVEDAIRVESILYKEGEKFVHIELNR